MTKPHAVGRCMGLGSVCWMMPWRGEGLCELDVFDVLAAACAVQGEAVADDLDDLGVRARGELVGGFAGRQVAAVLDGALDELVSLEGLFGLLGDGFGDIGFTDMDDGVEVMRQAAELANLLAIECHGRARFLVNGVLTEGTP